MKAFIILFLALVGVLHAQETIFVLDADSKEGVSFATLFFTHSKMGFVSNERGEIQLPFTMDDREINVYHVAYESYVGLIKDTILLTKKQHQIAEVLISNLSAKGCLQKIFENWNKNYPQQTHYLQGVYTQVHNEDNNYVRFIQAKAFIETLSAHQDIKRTQENFIAIEDIRKSFNYEKNGDQHGDHFVDLLLENPIQYNEKWVLNPKNIENYAWTIEMDSGYFKLHFRNVSWNYVFDYAGDIYVNPMNYAVEKIKVLQYKSDAYNRENKSNWWFINGWYEAVFNNLEGTYYLDHCNKWYYHLVESDTKRRFYVEENFNWETSSVALENNQNLNFKNYSNLYSSSFPYNPMDWNGYEIPNRIKVDLERYISLETQFIKKGNE